MQPERNASWSLLTRPIPSASNDPQPADLQQDGPLTWLPSDGTDLCFINSWSTTPIFSEAGPCNGNNKGGRVSESTCPTRDIHGSLGDPPENDFAYHTSFLEPEFRWKL
jgi:hypothetical protein